MTKSGACARIEVAPRGAGRCYIRRLATPLRKGVRMLMWRERLRAALRFLVCLALTLYILTTNAC